MTCKMFCGRMSSLEKNTMIPMTTATILFIAIISSYDLSAVLGDELDSAKLMMWVSQASTKINSTPLHPGDSIRVDIRDGTLRDNKVELHFLSKSLNTVELLAIRRNIGECPHSYLQIPESDWKFQQDSIFTNFTITPSLGWDGLVFFESLDFKDQNLSTEFWGWSPIRFKPCFPNDTEDSQYVHANSEGYVNVTLLDLKGQRKLKQEMREKCPKTLAEIHVLLHNKEKGTNHMISDKDKIYYNFNDGEINLCVNNTFEKIESNAGSPLDYANQRRQLYEIAPIRYIHNDKQFNPVSDNCVTFYLSWTVGNSFSFTLDSSKEVGIIRMKFNSENQWTLFFFSDQANKGDYVTVAEAVQNRKSLNIQLFYDTWQYSSSPLFSTDTVTCSIENSTLAAVSSEQADSFNRRGSLLFLKFDGDLPEEDEVDGECKINLRHYDNSIVTKVVEFTFAPPPKLYLEGSLIAEDDQSIFWITPDTVEIIGNISYGKLDRSGSEATVHLNCSNEILISVQSKDGSFRLNLERTRTINYDNCTVYAEDVGGISNLVKIKTLGTAPDTDGMSLIEIIAAFVGTSVLIIIIIIIAILLFRCHREKRLEREQIRNSEKTDAQKEDPTTLLNTEKNGIDLKMINGHGESGILISAKDQTKSSETDEIPKT